MARQIGDIFITGTIDDITFYEMEGKGYARRKSSLTGKKVKRDPRFRRTMQSAHRLARGSQLASRVYRSLPRPAQEYALFKELKSMAIRAIKEGRDEAEVLGLLGQHAGKVSAPVVVVAVVGTKTPPAAIAAASFTKKLFRVRGGRRGKVLGKIRGHSKMAEVLSKGSSVGRNNGRESGDSRQRDNQNRTLMTAGGMFTC
jgi:hypothetical protein